MRRILPLSWSGTIPGKRESRRFEGEYTLVQQDIIEQRHHPDAVAFGGWAIDLHPADGVYSSQNGCIQSPFKRNLRNSVPLLQPGYSQPFFGGPPH